MLPRSPEVLFYELTGQHTLDFQASSDEEDRISHIWQQSTRHDASGTKYYKKAGVRLNYDP